MKTMNYKTYLILWLTITAFILLHAGTVRGQFTNGNFSAYGGACMSSTSGTTGWHSNSASSGMDAQHTDILQPGNYWVDLTPCRARGNGTWIEQSVPMVVGNCYRIEFDLCTLYEHWLGDHSDAGVYITLDGQPLGARIFNDTIVPQSGLLSWKRRASIQFTATSNQTVVRFTGEGRCTAPGGSLRPCANPGDVAISPEVIAIDNITLVEITRPGFSLGNDTVYCGSFSRILDPGNGVGVNPSYRWSTGDTTQAITVTTPGTYSLVVTTSCGTASDTIEIGQAFYPVVDLGQDVQACSGDIVGLQSSGTAPTGTTYSWSTAAVTPSITVTQPGRYWLEMDQMGCKDSDTVDVFYTNIYADLGPDQTLCDRDTPVILQSPQPAGYQYLWSTGTSGATLRVTNSGDYWLEVSANGCKHRDSIRIDIVPVPDINIGEDSIICVQIPLVIGTEYPGASYRWNTGASTPYISVDSTGTYVLEVDMSGCRVWDTVRITALPAPEIDLGPDRDICPGQTIVLDATYSAGSHYRWHTGDTAATYMATSEGVYFVEVITDYQCVGADTVTLTHYPEPVVILGRDTSVCEETPLVLRPDQMNADTLKWSDGSTGEVLTVRTGGQYVVTAINKCGTGSDTVEVKNIFCEIWVPNAFTPNGDGVNDVFRVLGNTGRLEFFSLSVFNRWGERLFHTGDRHQGWDGVYKGSAALMGTYVYMLEYSIAGKPVLQKGNFHLLR